MGSFNFHKKKKARNTAKKREEKKAVLIALEDTKSSRFYFEDLINDKGLTGQVVFAEHWGTDPDSVIKAVIKSVEKFSHIQYEKKWIVIDRDGWSKSQINGTVQRAKDLDICVAISNEAYELWILLHFEKLTSSTGRVQLNHRLNKIFLERCGKKYEKSSRDVYRFTKEFQQKAVKNAQLLVEKHIRDHGKLKPYENNPLTTIFQLITCLNTLYSQNKQCECFPLE